MWKKVLQDYARENRREPTPTEKILWQKLRCKRMCGVRFHRQKPKLDYILDFYCPKARLAIEVDGVSAHDPVKDAIRDKTLLTANILTLRFTNRQVHAELGRVLDAIRETVKHRCATKPTETADRRNATVSAAT